MWSLGIRCIGAHYLAIVMYVPTRRHIHVHAMIVDVVKTAHVSSEKHAGVRAEWLNNQTSVGVLFTRYLFLFST